MHSLVYFSLPADQRTRDLNTNQPRFVTQDITCLTSQYIIYVGIITLFQENWGGAMINSRRISYFNPRLDERDQWKHLQIIYYRYVRFIILNIRMVGFKLWNKSCVIIFNIIRPTGFEKWWAVWLHWLEEDLVLKFTRSFIGFSIWKCFKWEMRCLFSYRYKTWRQFSALLGFNHGIKKVSPR